MIFETHCHLNSDEFMDDYDEVIKKAKDNDVIKFLDIACGENELKRSLILSEKYNNIYSAIGIHPVDYKMYTKEILHEYENLIDSNKKIIAYGEIGLDYYWYPETKEIQKEIFKNQIELAQKKKLPIIVHCREAAEDCYNILKEYAPINGVIHSFSENYEIAEKFLKLGMYIGISGPVTFKNGQNQRDVVKNIDINKLLIETDSPFLAPVPNRSKRNDPSNLKYILKEISNVRKQDINEIEKIIFNNSIELFKER